MWTLSFPDRVNAVVPWKVRMAEAEVVEPRPCANHPRVQTVVSCGRCDKPLCPRCMIYTPVGVRCRDCAQMRRPPQYTLTPRVYARVLPTAVALALVCGFLLSLVPYAGFLAGIVIGLLVGAALRRVSGYKQGRTMQVIAACTVIVGILSSNVFVAVRTFGADHLGDAIHRGLALPVVASSILGILIGIYVVIQRLR